MLKKPAKAGARAFIALEHLSSEVYELQERWKAVNTVPEDELGKLPEKAPTYNLATARLTRLIGGWEKCLSTARICFYGYSKQDALDAADLGLESLSNSHQKFLNDDIKEIIETMFNNIIELNVSSNKSEDIAGSPKVGKDARPPDGDDDDEK